MNLYCPRCATTFEDVLPEAFESGQCTTCHGQLAASDPSVGSDLVEGLVAMGFGDGFPVGMPLQVQLNNRELEASADYEAVTAARTEELRKVAAELAAKKAAAEAAAAVIEAAAIEMAANRAKQDLHANERSTSEEPTMPSVDEPPPETEAASNGGGDLEAAPAQPRNSAAVPANLDMPAFDFSMPALPDFGMPDAPLERQAMEPAAQATPLERRDEPGGEEAAPPASLDAEPPVSAQTGEAPLTTPANEPAAGASALPAHLQLPSFPKFDVSFDNEQPVAEERPPAAAPPGELGLPDGLPPLPGQEPAPLPQGPAAPPAGLPAHLVPGGLPTGGPPPTPPEAPAPPPPEPAAEALPSLPDLGLPDLPEEDHKREPTLLASEAASELAHELGKRRSSLPILIGALVAIAIIGGAAFWQRDTIIEVVTGEAPGPVVLTKEQKAEAALADGLLIAKDANNLEGEALKKKLEQAVAAYKKALSLNPKLALAHLRLAVAYAKTEEKAEAVKHYEKFVEIDPQAPQAKEVKKIIEDWYKAQEKKKGEEKSADEPDPKKKKRKKKR